MWHRLYPKLGKKYKEEKKMVLNPEERKIVLVEINGHNINPDEIKEINIPEKNDFVWEFTLKDDSTINATGNVWVRYI